MKLWEKMLQIILQDTEIKLPHAQTKGILHCHLIKIDMNVKFGDFQSN